MVVFGGLRWGFLMFSGIILFCLGIAIMVLQQPMFIWLFATLAMIDGVTTVVSSITSRRSSKFWWIYLLAGIIGIAFGLAALLLPAIRGMTFVYFVASWAIFIGIFKAAAAIQLQKIRRARVFPIILGLLSVGLGIFIMVDPGLGSSIIFWLIAALSLIIGTFFIVRASIIKGRIRTQQQIRQSVRKSAD